MKATKENMDAQNRLLLLHEFSIGSMAIHMENNNNNNQREINLHMYFTFYWVVVLDSSDEAQIIVFHLFMLAFLATKQIINF